MPSKMPLEEPNTIQGGNNMKCSFCGKHFKPVDENQDVCENCIHSVDELTNGKGEDEDDE